MPKVINYSDFIGQKFNSVTIKIFVGIRQDPKQKNAYIMGQCECGSIKEYLLYDVRSNRIRSCGCKPRGFKHGKCYTNIYKVLSGIKTRCLNKNSVPYKNYGGRGITCCKEWLECVDCFYDWAIENGYKEGLEIERINNNGNYEPSNCRWATPKEQCNNTRSNHFIEFNGERKTVAQWSEPLGLGRYGVAYRIKYYNWSVERAVTTPNGFRMRLGLIVPFRERYHHMNQFIPHYSRRMKNAKIFIIEQVKGKPFMRGNLINIGFREFNHQFDYFAAHDIDLLISKGDYSYCENPSQLATKAQQFNYKMPFPEYFGGATLFNNKDFILCNGYSNFFAGWGGEDSEMYLNVLNSGLTISYRDCWYQSLYHPPSHPTGFDPIKMEQAKQPRKENDGLSHCNYKIIDRIEFPLYTKIIVEL